MKKASDGAMYLRNISLNFITMGVNTNIARSMAEIYHSCPKSDILLTPFTCIMKKSGTEFANSKAMFEIFH